MWLGKFALISYIFSAVALGVGLLILNTTGVHLFENGTVTDESMNTLIGRQSTNATANPNFVFGDFIAGAQAIGTLILSSVTGGVVGDVMNSIPFMTLDPAFEIIFRIIFTFSSAMLIFNLLTGRDL